MRFLLKACLCLAMLSSSSAVSQDLQNDQHFKPDRDTRQDTGRAIQLALPLPGDDFRSGRGWVARVSGTADPIEYGIGNNAARTADMSPEFQTVRRGAAPSGFPPHTFGLGIADQQNYLWLGQVMATKMRPLAVRPNETGTPLGTGLVLRPFHIDFRF